ncbi:hypothetical protein VQ042_00125 [Aurantimonas sp. A2-1-M11]|uniref:hypothetical protein n=1 Tax=Aurantimonas sp. A2-1-M11 TaxID=3113712 RepID=UPI002F931F5D
MLAATLFFLSLGLSQPLATMTASADAAVVSDAATTAHSRSVPDGAYRLAQHRPGGGTVGRGDHRGYRDRRRSLDADRYLYDFRGSPRWRAEDRLRDRHRDRRWGRDRHRDWDRRHDRRDRDWDRDHRDRDRDWRRDRRDSDWDFGRGFDRHRDRDRRRGDDRFRDRRDRFEDRRKRW